MAPRERKSFDEKEGLLHNSSENGSSQQANPPNSFASPRHSLTSTSTTSLILENINTSGQRHDRKNPREQFDYRDSSSDVENPPSARPRWSSPSRAKKSKVGRSLSLKTCIWFLAAVAIVGWLAALFSFVNNKRYVHGSKNPYNHEAPSKSTGRQITLDSIQRGDWRPQFVDLEWIKGANGEDGLLLETNQPDKDFLVIEDVRSRNQTGTAHDGHVEDIIPSKILMKSGWFTPRNGAPSNDPRAYPIWTEAHWVSPDLTKVLILNKRKGVYRHSYTGLYFIFDVATQTAEVLDERKPDARVQLAQWSPDSNSIAFTRDNNVYVRTVRDSNGASSQKVKQVTVDGGSEYFYGIPDWVYEEEVFQNNVATWWSRDSKYIAFLRTNETMVPEYPIEYFLSRPSGEQPKKGLEDYPEEKRIKYPKAGAPNPVVEMLYYDLDRDATIDIKESNVFADDDRIVADIMWADDGQVLVKQLNRVSDKYKVVLLDVQARTARTVREEDLAALDGGWVEPAQEMQFIPADPKLGRPQPSYIDAVVYNNGDHIGYFELLFSSEPAMLTQGPNWEVEPGSVTVDLAYNMVYYTSTQVHSTQRHIFEVSLADRKIIPVTSLDTAYYSASFSPGHGFMILTNHGPGIPTQILQTTPTNSNVRPYHETLATNPTLHSLAKTHTLPSMVFTNITINGTVLNIMEYRPPHFDTSGRTSYPVLFNLYGGPNSQTVNRRFTVNYQSYVAATLGYLVVTLDNRGTGFIGRSARTIIRGQLGIVEASDQITCAKHYASLPYIDPTRIAIWGWSYGGFMTLKTLELDAGQTFSYGIAVAPVTDWSLYDSVYTERYMLTPSLNPQGYAASAITNVTALTQNVRFLMMHGVADDNVHFQNSLMLLDELDLIGARNYDVHVFPDSDHSIYFHNANSVVYGVMRDWLVGAFEGVWENYGRGEKGRYELESGE